MAVSGKAHVWVSFHRPRVSEILDGLPEGTLPGEKHEEGWKRLRSAGKGLKADRLYDYRIRLELNRPPQEEGFGRWLLVRRSIEEPEELTAYVVFAAEETTLQQLTRVAGSRWKIEEAFGEAKGEVGLETTTR